jgi:glycosyltransferase involved in cell wall biosynthesis
MPAPRVTVLLASRDRRAYLEEALASALGQSFADLEVLVVDDGSAAPTRDFLAEACRREPRLRVVFQPHAGVGAARARGVAEARGEIVAILDSDDLLLPGAVERLARELERDPDLDLLHGDIVARRPDGRETRRRYRPFASPRRMLWATLLSPRVPFKHSGTAFRRRAALEVGSYDPGLRYKVDVDLFLKFLGAGRRVRALAGEPLAVFRVHGGSLSRHRLAGLAAWFRLIDRHAPAGAPLRVAVKAVRAVAEAMKAAVESLPLR